MANFAYTKAKNLMLTGEFDWVNDPVSIVLIATGQYDPSVNHATLLDVPASARVAVSGTLSGRNVNGNVVDANDYSFTSVTGPQVNAVILFVNSGTEATSHLICHLDDAVAGVPFSPSSGPVNLAWSNGASKIFAL